MGLVEMGRQITVLTVLVEVPALGFSTTSGGLQLPVTLVLGYPTTKNLHGHLHA